MTRDDLQARLDALLNARFRGLRSVEYEGRRLAFATDGELAAAIADLERRIAALDAPASASRVVYTTTRKDL